MDKRRSLKRQLASCSDPLQAAHDFGQDHGVPELASKLNTPQAVLYNKLNPYNESNHLQLREAVFLTEITGDKRILEAWAAKAGGMFVPVPESVACDEDLSDQLLQLVEQLGHALAAVKEARSDGVITPQELTHIRHELTATVREVAKLDAVVESQVRTLSDKP
ncbi:phage regulatory CII family protein [Shewanella sp. KCT]|uniref:phage regulatory CII family protein n=1 Tax=Shewanella sp. KCT TaxID=2569535 RepID=UPI001182C3C3|nr:phage regulatory CII family protein [Shewanella sp. KCT]TVP11771.1 hypothetical protein AYI87_15180 [Shewanella sp. KCT]